jgi:vancomycin resistance protein YoaR
VPKDKDATVYYDTLDLKFKNITGNDIKIVATNTNSNVTIILNKITSGT